MWRTTSRLSAVGYGRESLWPLLISGLVLAVPWEGLQAQVRDANQIIDPALYQALEYRSVGPTRGGRATAVTGVRGQPQTYYMGSTDGGVWKTTDAGIRWTNVSDAYFEARRIAAVG